MALIFYLYAFLPKSFFAEFKQSYTSAITGKKKEDAGTIKYSYPRKLRLTTGDGVIFIVKDKSSKYYTPPFIEGEPGELVISEENNALVYLLDSLSVGLSSNKVYKVDTKKDKVEIKFVDTSYGLSSVNLSFREKISFNRLKTVTLHYQDNRKIDLEIMKIEEVVLVSNDFEFTPPNNTSIIK